MKFLKTWLLKKSICEQFTESHLMVCNLCVQLYSCLFQMICLILNINHVMALNSFADRIDLHLSNACGCDMVWKIVGSLFE
jgi:hypothetical protein